MNEYRCRKCGRLLFKADADGRVQIVCTRCNVLQIVYPKGQLQTAAR
jgi:phage FluMu protein Com